MPKNNAISPEYLYYFEAEADSRHQENPDSEYKKPPSLHGITARISHAIISGLAKFCLFLIAISAPLSEAVADEAAGGNIAAVRGADTLKAQISALRGELSDLKRLQRFLGDLDDADELARAQHLIETMPAHEKAGAAAWRIAAVTSLNLESGIVSNLEIDTDYRLVQGAIGWDFGPEGATVHRGFTPVTSAALGAGTPVTAVRGETPLTDGVTALESFQGSLPNGLYRVLIVREKETAGVIEEAPFGDQITINGVTLNSRNDTTRLQRHLSGSTDRITAASHSAAGHTDRGLGMQGWAIVEDGTLQIDFAALPAGRMISAVIAEPFDIDKIDLQSRVAETLAEALGGVAPAAGPTPRAAHRRARQTHRPVGVVPQQVGAVPVERSASGARRGPASSASGARFAASRRPVGLTSSAGSPAISPAPAPIGVGAVFDQFGETDTPPFEDRQLLVKRSIGEGEDSDGMAVDLGSVLDDASPSGTFLCTADPCVELPPVATEPDLAAAAELLGDWLDTPTHLSDDWTTLEAVLGLRAPGAEVAVVYEFDVDAGGWTDLELQISAGSGIFVWLDGDYIFGAVENGGFVDDLDFEYRIELPDLAGGTHFLQIVSESHIEDQGFALELRGTPIVNVELTTTSVNEPGTLFLIGFGLLCFALIARRHVSPRQDTGRADE